MAGEFHREFRLMHRPYQHYQLISPGFEVSDESWMLDFAANSTAVSVFGPLAWFCRVVVADGAVHCKISIFAKQGIW